MRQANKFDIPELWNLILQFREETPISYIRNIENEEHFKLLMLKIIAGCGIVYIEPNKGFIAGLIAPSIWCNETLVLHELAWYVKPEYRQTILGYRLLKTYIDYAKKLKEEKRIVAFTMGKMANSPNIKYEKFGFSKLEENWIQ